MAKTRKTNVMPQTQMILNELGENIKNARLRRNLPVSIICERADVSRATLWKVEKGDPSVAIGIYAVVLHALQGMDRDLLLVAKDEILGKTMDEFNIRPRKRASGGK